MSEAKHTPGVWYAEPPDDESDDFRSKYFWKVRVRTESNGGWQLAHISSLNTGHEESNARVMAAAPDLLAVAECEEALECPMDEGLAVLQKHGFDYEGRFDFPATEFVRRMRKAALAKATEAQ